MAAASSPGTGGRRDTWPDAAVFAGLLALVVVAKAPVLATPYYWDETLWIGFAHDLAKGRLMNVLPGFHAPFLFGNRPPGLFLPMAAIFKVTAPSIWLSHAFILCFAVLGLFFTYRLAASWFGRNAGVLAALFLFFNATYFTQSAMFLCDLPVTALAVASVYFGVQRRFWIYWPCALYLLTLKEPAMATVAALSAWAFVVRVRSSFADAVTDAVRYAAPLFVMAMYYAWQWRVTGFAFVHYNFPFEPALANLGAALRQLPMVHRWVLVEQGRWWLSLVTIVALAAPSFRRRKELLLVALLVVAAGYSYTFLYFLPRYILPAAPFLCAASAGAVVTLLRDARLQIAAAALLIAALVPHIEERPRRGNREWNMGYRRIVKMHQDAAAFIERELGGRKVLAEFPLAVILERPKLGYVSRPVKVVWATPEVIDDPPPIDLIVVGEAPDDDDLESYVDERRLTALARFDAEDAYVTIYDASPARAPTP